MGFSVYITVNFCPKVMCADYQKLIVGWFLFRHSGMSPHPTYHQTKGVNLCDPSD